ncbi:SDR family oxidoreductase [Falsirhodobacter halotolerans]|uniref:SDR family oxidoreductase n=1 Tax=Falsirhodobacter halotolerans TaxID=1146892 RepID=UPI001FD2A149|nr:SDR family oxidoreductase [Falsirhodobacter halotolerans]MCJ8138245.1 SDR family oxidoreductase [Falsirhodobacter halotolerans]
MDRDAPADFTPRFPGSGRLAGKVCLISGSSSGIGRAVAMLFAREGAKVVVTYHKAKEEGDEVLAAVKAEGAEGLALHLDATDRASCRAAVAQTVEAFGGLDVLVCNAGIQRVETDIAQIDPDWVEKIFATNVYGYIWLAQAALEHMREGASIVCTTSVNAYRGHPVLLDYSATKGAELGFLRALAANLADKGIRVNGVAPGPIWTPLIGETMPENVANFGTDVPMKRPGQPNEVAPAYLFLASADGSYVTGQVLHPNGGIPING